MADLKDLDEFGFEPVDAEDFREDSELSEFGFEPLDLEEEPVQEDDDGIMSKIPSEVKGTTLGAISGKAAQKSLEKIGDVLPEASERMAARALGLFDTVEGRKYLKEQASQLGLPKGAISPESIGRLALDENWLGTFGFKSSADQLEDIDSSMLDSIKRKQDLLDKVRGTKELSTITKKTQDIIGPLDIDLDPDAPKIEKAIYNEFEKSFDEDGRFIPKYKTAKELEDAKVRLQERQKYQATRADSAQDRIEKARARALREGTEELVELEGLGDEFKDIKSEIGSKGVARKVALGKSIKDLKSYDLDMGSATSLALGRPEIPLTRMALRKGTAPIAKAMDLGAKVLSSKPVRTVLRGLPVLGAYAGFEAARAEGLSTSEAVGRTAIEEARDLVLGPISALFGGDTGARKNSIEYKLESGEPLTDEERKELAKRSNEFMKNQMINNPDKVDFSKVASEYKEKLGEKSIPLYNQLMSIAEVKDPRRQKAKMHFLSQKPEYKKLTEMLENKQVEDIKMSQEIMSVDPELQKDNNLDNLEVFNERKKTIDLENEDPTKYNYDNLSFKDAFNAARADQNNIDNGVFEWRGKKYNTALKNSDKKKVGREPQGASDNNINLEDVKLLDDYDQIYSNEDLEIEKFFDNLKKKEGIGDKTGAAETGNYGITQKAINALKNNKSYSEYIDNNYDTLKEIDSLPVDQRSQKYDQLMRLYVDYLNNKMPNNFKGLPDSFNKAILDSAYNIGESVFNYKGLGAKIKEAKKFKKDAELDGQFNDLEKNEYKEKLAKALKVGLFDVLNATTEKTGERGMFKGLAKRRAESYNEFAKEESMPLVKFVKQENNEIKYLDKDRNVIYSQKGRIHSQSKDGEIELK